jgi:alcohol dehydrogenase class IV
MALPEEVVEFKLRTKIVFRDGAVEELPYELEELGAKRLVVFTDKGVIDAGILDYVKGILEDSDVEIVGIFDKIQQDALVSVINEAARYVKEVGADSILAVGGGSVMDTAKGANVLVTGEEEDIAEHIGAELIHRPMLPHVAIPTTSGTGCEVTWGAVIKNEEEQTKTGFIEWYCVADVAILDPQVTKSMPPRLTASTGIDALTHAIEGYTSPYANPLTDAMNLHAVRLVGRWLPVAVHRGDDIEARSYMAFAAAVAGVGFFNSMCGAVHACAHALGGVYGIPHGMANAVMLPVIMEYNRDYVIDQYRDVAGALGVNVHGMDPEEAARAAVDAVKKLIEEIDLPTDLKEWGVKEEDLPLLAEKAMEDSQMMFNPRPAEEEEILELFRRLI